MSLYIKICGLTTAAAIDAAVKAGADAIGFVFHAPSKRYVTPAKARELSRAIPSHIQKVAVARTLTPSQWQQILEEVMPDVIQLDADELDGLRLPQRVAALPVYRESHPPLRWPARCLWEGLESGVGQIVDWSIAAEVATHTQLVLAGGLDPQNVTAAIETVKPFGVDVSSGVEVSPGVKDDDKIARFIQAARAVADKPYER